MKSLIIIVFPLISCANLYAQKLYTKNGSISFLSKTSMENIEAKNNQVVSVLNPKTGELQFSVLIKAFHFEKALMEEHFNENYMESNKFPKATFKGVIKDVSEIDFLKNGSYNVSVQGELTVHGVTNKVKEPGILIVKKGLPAASSKFTIKLKDYRINIPKLVKNNISETIEISVVAVYDQKM